MAVFARSMDGTNRWSAQAHPRSGVHRRLGTRDLYQSRSAQADLAKFNIKTRIAKDDNEEKSTDDPPRELQPVAPPHPRPTYSPFIDDIIVRPEYLPEFLPKLNALMDKYALIYTIAGHIGNGNFHIIPLMKMTDPKKPPDYRRAFPKVYDLVFQYHGSMTAEHNDGLIRSPFLKQMYGPEVYTLFEEVKIFDPRGIFNPGKVGSSLPMPCNI